MPIGKKISAKNARAWVRYRYCDDFHSKTESLSKSSDCPKYEQQTKNLILHTELKTPELILLEIPEPFGSIAQIIDDSQQDLISSHSGLDNNFCLGYHKLSKFHAFRNCI